MRGKERLEENRRNSFDIEIAFCHVQKQKSREMGKKTE